MMDEAESRGINIDTKQLSNILGVDVINSVATHGIGVAQIKSHLKQLKCPKKIVKYPKQIDEFCSIVSKLLSGSEMPLSRGFILLLLTGSPDAYQHLAQHLSPDIVGQIKKLSKMYRENETIPFEALLTNIYNKHAALILEKVQEVHTPAKNRNHSAQTQIRSEG